MSDEKYHYTECGLDYVYLLNGFETVETPQGEAISIRNIDALHRAIGEFLCDQDAALAGKEIRFLRGEMGMSQRTFAHLFSVEERTVSRWETGETDMPKQSDVLLRLLYEEHANLGNGSIKDILEKIADLEDEIDRTHERVFQLQAREHEEPEVWARAA